MIFFIFKIYIQSHTQKLKEIIFYFKLVFFFNFQLIH